MIGLDTIDKLLRWGKPREVIAKGKPKLVRSAMATEDFWAAWNEHEQELRALGISVGRDYEDPNKWRVSHWQEVDAAILAEREKRLDMSGATSAEIELPKPDGLEYMPFQKAGVRYCLDVFKTQDAGVLIGDDPGLGKTIQAIGVINATPEISRILIICPMTLKSNWERELTRWLVRPLTIGYATSEFWPRTDIVIAHYNILHKFPTRLTTYWDLLVVDECHRCGNSKTRQTRCIVGHKPTRKEAAQGVQPTSGIPAKRKLMLSGTPFENRPAELWPIVSYIAPGLFSSRSAFEKRYCGGQMGSHGWEAVGATNLQELGERLRGRCMIRRKKDEVLKELPPKTRVVIELSAEGLGESVRREQGAWSRYGSELEAAHVTMELAKASDDEAAFKAVVADLRKKLGIAFTEIARVRHETALAKLPAMVELLREEIEELGSPKIVVFAHHTDVLKIAHAAFPGSVLITGDTPADERDKIVQRFQTEPSCGPFFGSIRATGEGITLTAASTVVFFENDWTASKMAQCSDRCHRYGQKDNVLVKYYILPGTIDAHMIQTWIRKEEILEQALDTAREELASEPTLVPKAEPLATRHQLTVAATAIMAAQRAAILDALKRLSAMCDGALAIDGQGFCKFDVAIGKSLALQSHLSPMQAALGQKLLAKYVRQLGHETLVKCGIKTKA